MSAPASLSSVEQSPNRFFRLPELALRRRSADHPMATFLVIGTAAFLAILVPSTGTAFAPVGIVPQERSIADRSDIDVSETRTTPKAARVTLSESDIACRGQSWGTETAECLAVIAKESGRAGAPKVRTIADAGPNMMTPNVF